MQMAWDHGYRKDNPVRGIRLKGVPTKPIVVATKDQFVRVYNLLPFAAVPAVGAARGVVRRAPTGGRFLTRQYTKNGEHRRFKIDHAVAQVVQEHITLHEIAPAELIFPVRLFATTEPAGKPRLGAEEIDALGYTEELPNGYRYKHGTLDACVTARCRCSACMQWSRDYSRERKRARTGRAKREWSSTRRSDPTEYLGTDAWRPIWTKAVHDAELRSSTRRTRCATRRFLPHRPRRQAGPHAVPSWPRRPSGDD